MLSQILRVLRPHWGILWNEKDMFKTLKVTELPSLWVNLAWTLSIIKFRKRIRFLVICSYCTIVRIRFVVGWILCISVCVCACTCVCTHVGARVHACVNELCANIYLVLCCVNLFLNCRIFWLFKKEWSIDC